MAKKFEHNAGGVLRVEFVGRWGAIPESLIEDDRLGLDSRAVAAWLAIRPPGWIITISALLARLGIGREKWNRIRNELQSAGYFFQKKTYNESGKIVWDQVFTPVPDVTIAGLSSNGSASAGSDSNKRKPRGFSISIKHQASNRSWMQSDAGIVRRGKELGLEARVGESMQAYRMRIAEEERKQRGN